MNLLWDPDSSFEVGLVRLSLLRQYQRPQRQKRSLRGKTGEIWTLNKVLLGGQAHPAGGRQQITHCEAAAETPPGCGHPVIMGVSCGDRGSVIKVNNYWESIPTEEESEPTGHYPANPTLSLSKLHIEKLLPDLGWPVILITNCLPQQTVQQPDWPGHF